MNEIRQPLAHRMLVSHRGAPGLNGMPSLLRTFALDVVAQRHELLGAQMIRENERVVAAVRIAFVVVGADGVIDVIGVQTIAGLRLRVGPDIRLSGSCGTARS